MNRNEIIRRAAEAFAANPKVQLFYVTKDGMCFLRKQDAGNHEKLLGNQNKGVEEITRESVAREISGVRTEQLNAEQERARALKDTLLGSSKQPAHVKVKSGKKQLGEIVRMAYTASGMTVGQWNEQPEADREAAIEKVIAELNKD